MLEVVTSVQCVCECFLCEKKLTLVGIRMAASSAFTSYELGFSDDRLGHISHEVQRRISRAVIDINPQTSNSLLIYIVFLYYII